ncbi:hypothetical protein [Lacrimispora aerotolerans]|uniref:hypothetical protein n=1 Tax=Lacrimispora aerotolerans TaxID=36832 RepID=UPI00047E556A|nr:hypothetical protein [Lacrimispora aerotolerans]
MNKNGKLIGAVAAAVILTAAITVGVVRTAEGNLDVIGKGSEKSFEAVIGALPDAVKRDETSGGWSLTSPDDSVRVIWSEDYQKSPVYDVMLKFDAKPFLDAGLDESKLPDIYKKDGEAFLVGSKFSKEGTPLSGEADAISAYRQIGTYNPDIINYHSAMDHYGLKLGDGNMFEWAKNMETNTASGKDQDKDIVFVLNPEPLLAAGVDPQKVEGWVYATVPVMDHGKNIEVYKFLKPFNIK